MNSKAPRTGSKSPPGGTNFLITVHRQEHQSWQGTIQWLDTGRKVHFRSELELMHLIREALQTQEQSDEPLRNWDDDQQKTAFTPTG